MVALWPHVPSRPTSSTTWKNAGVGSKTYLVSEDAAFDARRTRSLQPPPRFTAFADHVAHSRPVVNTRPSDMDPVGPEAATWEWRFRFHSHWGAHATSAIQCAMTD